MLSFLSTNFPETRSFVKSWGEMHPRPGSVHILRRHVEILKLRSLLSPRSLFRGEGGREVQTSAPCLARRPRLPGRVCAPSPRPAVAGAEMGMERFIKCTHPAASGTVLN